MAMTKEAVLAFRDVAGLGVFFDPVGDVFLNPREYTISGVTGGDLVVDAGGGEVLQNKTSVFWFFHNSRAEVFIAGDDDKVILVS
jgi:hypothetical protein